jgi:hypothetical protein
LIKLAFDFSLSGKPLSDADVIFEPEEFMGDSITAATGKTDVDGRVGLKSEYAKQNGRRGMSLGFYRVKVSKISDGKETIPAKYSSATTLGRVVTEDDRVNDLIFKLKR